MSNINTKRLSYVHPAAESENSGIPSELIQNTLNFVNEHDGWTDDYRYSRYESELLSKLIINSIIRITSVQ